MMGQIELLRSEFAGPLTYVVLPVALLLSAIAWKRSAFRPAIGVLECLRLAMISLVLFALHQPERVHFEETGRLPKVAVLWDNSSSMETRDVLIAGAADAAPESRASWTSKNVDLEALRSELAGRFDVVGGPLDLAPDGTPDGTPQGESETSAGTRAAATDMGSAMRRILEDPEVRALVLYGDGDWNSGANPAEVAMQFRMRDLPIVATTIGSRTALPDIELLALEPPTFALVGKPVAIPFTLRSSMDRDVSLAITLEGSDGQMLTQDVLIRAQSTIEGSFNVTPNSIGEMKLSARVPVEPGEFDAANNQREATMDVREESLRILLVESIPRWEYRFLRNAMVRDPGVLVDCFLLHPKIDAVGAGATYLNSFPPRAALSEYDVIFIGDVGLGPNGLTSQQCADIRGVVSDQACGLILMPGMEGEQLSLSGSELDPLLPVEFDEGAPFGHGSSTPARLRLTESGRASSLTKLAGDPAASTRLWEDLPGFQWHAAVTRARPGSNVLAVHESRDDGNGRVPLLVTRTFGTGKVLFMGTDGAWRWRKGVEDLVHYRFWRQVVRWMAYQRKMNAGESMRFFHTPDRPAVRSTVSLYANAMDAAGAPLRDATLIAKITSPSGQVTRIEFEDDGEWGLYRGSFRSSEPGDHAVALKCTDTGAQLDATLAVAGAPLEQLGRPARFDVMEEIARISRGTALTTGTSADMKRFLSGLKDRPRVARRTRLWSHPLLGLALLILMACFWGGRKLAGRF